MLFLPLQPSGLEWAGINAMSIAVCWTFSAETHGPTDPSRAPRVDSSLVLFLVAWAVRWDGSVRVGICTKKTMHSRGSASAYANTRTPPPFRVSSTGREAKTESCIPSRWHVRRPSSVSTPRKCFASCALIVATSRRCLLQSNTAYSNIIHTHTFPAAAPRYAQENPGP